MMNNGVYKFRKHDSIGSADAESDNKFLENCFIDTGDLSELRNPSSPKRIVVGRTGAGKTALLSKLKQTEERVIEIQPESLSFGYIANSNILSFFSGIGVDLDLFYKLLWRHIFTVELIKARFNINTETDKRTWINQLKNLFRNRRHQQAVEYLEQWGKSFWQDTEYRIKEITTKVENDLSASIGVPINPALGVQATKTLSDEQKVEVLQRGQKVINEVQIRQLSEMLDLLDEALDDPQKHYFIVIDKLDEKWTTESVRYKLIRALIETIRDFKKVRNAKIIVGMRLDLLDRVFKITRDPGLQGEKYESLYLYLTWTKPQLTQLIDLRINHLIKHTYTTQIVTHRDIFPKAVRSQNTLEYILDRTLMRPREVILFINQCIYSAVDSTSVTPKMILAAEGEYSRLRIDSLGDEWAVDYPNLKYFVNKFLKNRTQTFKISEISDEFCLEFSGSKETLETVCKNTDQFLEKSTIELHDGGIQPLEFKKNLFSAFYHVGLVALKLAPEEKFLNIVTGRRNISIAEINESSTARINSTFRRVLGIVEPEKIEE
ncbi:MAG: hypothetical protein IPL30_05655 [Elusimicrobia bacterium]|nr:hypothetical protein [Elusimicrobiota bacterium]